MRLSFFYKENRPNSSAEFILGPVWELTDPAAGCTWRTLEVCAVPMSTRYITCCITWSNLIKVDHTAYQQIRSLFKLSSIVMAHRCFVFAGLVVFASFLFSLTRTCPLFAIFSPLALVPELCRSEWIIDIKTITTKSGVRDKLNMRRHITKEATKIRWPFSDVHCDTQS